MTSCEALEQPGWWRSLSLAAIVIACFGTALPLLWGAFTQDMALVGGFGAAIVRSLVVAIAVAATSLVLGVPAGLLSALYEFPLRRTLLALLAVPLLVPSFLWAIGLSQLRIQAGLPPDNPLSGVVSTIAAFATSALPLVIYMTFVSARHLSQGQIDSARLAGGESFLFACAARAVLPAAILAATLAAILTLSDPGPGQILGFSGIAYEILVSFSATYDFALAAQECAVLAGIVLLIAVPVAILIAPKVAAEVLGRDVGPVMPARNRGAASIGISLLACIVVLTAVLPLIGIVRPLFTQFPAARALQEIARTLADTLLYAFTAGIIATGLGIWFALAAGRDRRARTVAVAAVFLILSLPPSLTALGIIQLATIAPAWLDPLLRSRLTVGIALALRFVPIAAVLAMRSFGTIAPSQCLAGAVHGLPLSLYLRRVLGPQMLPAALIACAVIALEATAEVGTVLLLRPPGADSIPVQIFTVMANAPEALVAALCLFYVMGAALVLVSGWLLTGRTGGT